MKTSSRSLNRYRSRIVGIATILGIFAAWMAWKTAKGDPVADGLPAPTTCPAGMTMQQDKVPFCPRQLGMIRIPAGKIEMPTTRPGLKTEVVEIKPIWISATEVTWDHYDPFWMCRDMNDAEKMRAKEVTKTRPSNPNDVADRQLGHDGYGAISLTYKSANEYCKWLSKQSGKKYRLPTEAEWEYACRCGGPEVRLSEAELDKVAWFAENSKDINGDPVPHPVASKAPNAWGLYDMLGNVGEWVMGYDGRPVLKGGTYLDSFKVIHSGLRVAYKKEWQARDCQRPQSTWWLSDGPHAGFRVVREE